MPTNMRKRERRIAKPEADAITRLNDLGFADVRIAYRRYMDAVLIAHRS